MIIDTDTNCTNHLASLKARGVTHIGRYYAAKGSKRLSKAEARAISDAGLQVFVVYEDSGDPELTIARGVRDAGIALAMAQDIGQPPDTAIYFAMEHLPSGYDASHVPGIKAYFEGIRRTLPAYKIGCYSNGTTLRALLDAQLIDYAWVSASTSFAGSREFLKTDRWHLAQRKVDLNWGGVSTDTNDMQGDFGAWALPARDNIDTTLRKLNAQAVSGSMAGAASAAADEPIAPTVAATVTAKAGLLDRFAPNAAKAEELANQGSRTAQALRNVSTMFWKFWGAVLAMLGLGSQVDPTKGPAHDAGSWGSQHPFLLAFLCITVTALIITAYVYWKAHKAQKGLAAAAKDGRYETRGAAA